MYKFLNIMTLVISMCSFLAFVHPAHADIEAGAFAPALSVKKFDGTNFDLEKLKGKVVVLNFWATWCAACRDELPEIAAFSQAYQGKEVEVLAISVDRLSDRDRAEEVAQLYRLPGGMFREATTKFDNPEYVPTTYILDVNGLVQAKLVPDGVRITKDSIAEVVDKLLPSKAKK